MRWFQLDASFGTAARLARAVVAQRLGYNQPLFASCCITERCNVRCDGCVYFAEVDPHLNAPEADTDAWIRILEGLHEGGVAIAMIAGGEPFVRADLPEILRGGKAAGMSLCVITNGMLVNDRGLEAVDECCEWAVFSPHTASEVGGPSGQKRYEEGWRGFAKMREALDRPQLTCGVTVGKHTVEHLDEIFERAMDTGADAVRFQPQYFPEKFPSAEQLDRAMVVIEKWRRRYPKVFLATDKYVGMFPSFFSDEPVLPCTAQRFFHLGVMPDGNVSACCPKHIPIGNLLEMPLRDMLKTEVETVSGCYGCHRLDLMQSLKLCGTRGLEMSPLPAAFPGGDVGVKVPSV